MMMKSDIYMVYSNNNSNDNDLGKVPFSSVVVCPRNGDEDQQQQVYQHHQQHQQQRYYLGLKLISIALLLLLFLFYIRKIMDTARYSNNAIQQFVKKKFRVVLFGDSLINNSCEEFQLNENLKSQFPDFDMEIINAGLNGDHISFMRARLYDDVIAFKPDAVMMLWDSDIADQSNGIVGDKAVQIQYKEDLYFILQHLKANNCSHISVSGPVTVQEGPLFVPSRYQGKEKYLDAYRDINMQVCNRFDDILYIDLRKAFQKSIPSWWLFSRWYLTSDGEHPNDRGVQIIARKFGKILSKWVVG